MSTKRDTTLKPWPRRGTTIESMTAWREYVRDHIRWIEASRADLPLYGAIRKTYLREFLRVSVELQRLKAANRKREIEITTRVKAA